MLVLLCTTSCKSCFNKYEEMPNGITLTVSNKLKEHLLQSNLPTLHFDYNNVRVMIESDGAACFFVSAQVKPLLAGNIILRIILDIKFKNDLEYARGNVPDTC